MQNCPAGCRVVLVLDTLELGGSERQAILHARCLIEQGAQVQLVALGPGQAAKLADELGVPWRVIQPSSTPAQATAHELGASRQKASGGLWQAVKRRQPRSVRLLRYAVRLGYELRRYRPHVILSYTLIPNLVCGLAWRWTGACLFVWNQREVSMSSGWPAGERLAMRLTPCFLSNSVHGAAYLAQVHHVAPGRIHVIPNGIELRAPRDNAGTWRQRLGLVASDFVTAMVANLSHFKDHDTLLQAWRYVLDNTPTAARPPVLLLVGRYDDTYEALCRQASELSLQDHVRFLGPIEDVSGLLGAVDAGVYSSRAEGSPNAVLEYMAAGLPVVATDIPGIREVVGEAGQRWLAPAGDARALAQLILEMLNCPDEHHALGASHRARVEQRYSMGQMCATLTELLTVQLILKQRPVTTPH